MPTATRFLQWSDVDPATHAFDLERVRAIVTSRITPSVARTAAARRALEESLDRALIAEHGAWAAGWRWTASEPGCGGPVRAYCCAVDSLLRARDRSPAAIDRVVAAMAEWRTFLEELASTFRALREATRDLAIDEAVERAAARLLPIVVERTSAEDAWYATFERILSWYLEREGHDPSGRSSTWVGSSRAPWDGWFGQMNSNRGSSGNNSRYRR